MSKDEQVDTSALYQTTDHKKFKTIAGNRYEDKKHTRQLIKKIKKEGNLTQYFPIIVNEKMEVIDGLHRLRALEQLKQPVFYEIKEGLNVQSVISLNTGHKNWTWYDYAVSWMERGNKNYAQLLELYDMFKERFSTLMVFATGNENSSKNSGTFHDGDFVMRDFDTARRLLLQYQELTDASGYNNRNMATAAYKYMRTLKYDHQRMIQKLSAYGERLARCYTTYDYLSAFDEIYRAS